MVIVTAARRVNFILNRVDRSVLREKLSHRKRCERQRVTMDAIIAIVVLLVVLSVWTLPNLWADNQALTFKLDLFSKG